ncbi:MAG: LysE family transporter [Candidatus Gracilibacteria bacterium]|jgi:threonine/homoserine/homoserine lactone efflux protein
MFTPEAFLFGFTQGFVLGPLSLYAIREGLNPKKGFWYQLQVILGSFVVDIVYLLMATYGIAHFVENQWVKVVMWTFAGCILIRMGFNSLHEKPGRLTYIKLHGHRLTFFDNDFVKGFIVSLFNPMAVVFSLMIVGSLYASYAGSSGPATFAMNVNLGGVAAGLIVCGLTYAVRQVFHAWMIKKLMFVGSMVLIGYGAYFSFKAFAEIQPMVEAAFASIYSAM